MNCKNSGTTIDERELEKQLGIPVLFISARARTGLPNTFARGWGGTLKFLRTGAIRDIPCGFSTQDLRPGSQTIDTGGFKKFPVDPWVFPPKSTR
jgi:hypothetical protein